MVESLEVLERTALGFANVLRAVTGLGPADRLEPGVPHSCPGCPVAATAGGWRNGAYGWEVGAGGALLIGPKGAVRKTVPVPSDVLEFMAAFDAGMYPHLTLEAVAA